eukprot:849137-Pelagomonas_calceolata.AAC.4
MESHGAVGHISLCPSILPAKFKYVCCSLPKKACLFDPTLNQQTDFPFDFDTLNGSLNQLWVHPTYQVGEQDADHSGHGPAAVRQLSLAEPLHAVRVGAQTQRVCMPSVCVCVCVCLHAHGCACLHFVSMHKPVSN